mmetsp:Transcript_37794/g.122190  ORF Transcript_37794/g.122190 Transcript_37794/m.122190 type:complete len:239 (+) Transcript_37794:256-972(+)
MRSVGSSALITPAACVENAIRMDSVEYVPSAGSRSPLPPPVAAISRQLGGSGSALNSKCGTVTASSGEEGEAGRTVLPLLPPFGTRLSTARCSKPLARVKTAVSERISAISSSVIGAGTARFSNTPIWAPAISIGARKAATPRSISGRRGASGWRDGAFTASAPRAEPKIMPCERPTLVCGGSCSERERRGTYRAPPPIPPVAARAEMTKKREKAPRAVVVDGSMVDGAVGSVAADDS